MMCRGRPTDPVYAGGEFIRSACVSESRVSGRAGTGIGGSVDEGSSFGFLAAEHAASATALEEQPEAAHA